MSSMAESPYFKTLGCTVKPFTKPGTGFPLAICYLILQFRDDESIARLLLKPQHGNSFIVSKSWYQMMGSLAKYKVRIELKVVIVLPFVSCRRNTSQPIPVWQVNGTSLSPQH